METNNAKRFNMSNIVYADHATSAGTADNVKG